MCFGVMDVLSTESFGEIWRKGSGAIYRGDSGGSKLTSTATELVCVRTQQN